MATSIECPKLHFSSDFDKTCTMVFVLKRSIISDSFIISLAFPFNELIIELYHAIRMCLPYFLTAIIRTRTCIDSVRNRTETELPILGVSFAARRQNHAKPSGLNLNEGVQSTTLALLRSVVL